MVAYLGAMQTLLVGTRCCHHIFMYRKYYVKHISLQCNLDLEESILVYRLASARMRIPVDGHDFLFLVHK